MKKNYFLIILIFSLGLATSHGQKWVPISPSKFNKAVVIQHQADVLEAPPLDFLSDISGSKTQYGNSKISGQSFSDNQQEEVIGITQYDLQSNASLANRMTWFPDGTMAAVWTMGLTPTSFPDRGTGYNYFDGTSWEVYPTSRIETVRTGWPSHAAWGSNGELIAAHDNSVFNIVLNKRGTKGTGAWTESYFNPPAGQGLAWPRISTSGPSRDIIHLLTLTLPTGNGGTPYMGQDGALLYNRSQDGGATWDKQHVILPGMGSSNYLWLSADEYVWAEPRGNTIAFLVSDHWHDMFVMKSTDNGDNWQKITVWEHPYPFFDWDITITTDTVWSPDGTADIAIDNNGDVHVVCGLMRVTHDQPGTNFSFFPYTDGIAYWNENRPPFTAPDQHDALDAIDVLVPDYNLIGWTQDINNNGQMDFVDIYSYRSGGISGMPELSIDEYNNVFLVYASTTEGYDNGSVNYKHLWARGSNDGGVTWGNFIDLNDQLIHIFDECIYPVMSGNSNDRLHLIYNVDWEPGTAIDGDHPYQDNSVYYLEIDKSDLINYTPSQNISTFPYTQSFESGLAQWQQSADDDFDWTWQTGPTTSLNTGPSGAYEGTYYLYTEASSPNNPLKTAGLYATFDFLGNVTNPELSFWYHMYGDQMGSLAVQVSLNGGTSWSNLWNLSGNQGDQWFNALVDLSVYGSLNNVMIRFLGTTGIGYRSDMAIDYIHVEGYQSPPPCATFIYPPDEGIDVPVDAQLEWGAAPDATGYLIWFGTDNPPTNIENGTDLGNVLIYTPASYLNMLTDYYWKIVPYNTAGQATGCPTFSFTTELSPPQSLEATINGIDVHLSWQPPLNMDGSEVLLGYNVYRDGNQINASPVSTLFYDDLGLPVGVYSYYVTAVYSEGESSPSNTVQASVLPPGCTSLVYPPNESTNIPIDESLVWDPESLATGYLIFFGTDYPPSNIENGTDLGDVTTYNPAALLEEFTEYHWKIVPYNAVGQATGCSIWSFTTGANPYPAPMNLQAQVQNDFDVLLSWDEPLYKQSLYEDDFEYYSAGDFLAVENPTWWTTWSNQPGSAEDVPVSGDVAYSGSKSIIIQNSTDAVLKLGDKTSGYYEINFWCYLPTGYGGYYNIQHFEAPGIEWAYQVYFGENGSAQLDAGIESAATFNYPKDQWFLIENTIDIDNDWTVLKVNGNTIYEWPFHYQPYVTTGTTQLGSMNIFAGGFPAETPKYYIDNISYTEFFTDKNHSKNLLGYNVYRDGNKINSSPVGDLTYLDENLPAGQYDYFVKAEYTGGTSSPSNVVTVQITDLFPPENLTATVSFPDVHLEWEQPQPGDSSKATFIGYNVYRDTDPITATPITDLFYNDLGLPNGTYEYYVTAVYVEGESYPSNTATAILELPGCTNPVYPLNAATGIPVMANLSWNEEPAAEGYLLWLGTDFPPTNLVNGDDLGNILSYVPASFFEENTTYYWQIIPYNNIGQASGCSVWSFTTGQNQFATPMNLEATVQNDIDVLLTWDPPAQDEEIYWCNLPDVGQYEIGLTNGGTFHCAARWTPADLIPYNGKYLKTVKFYCSDEGTGTTFKIMIWKGANAGTLLIEQSVTGLILDSWNEVVLTTPVLIDGSQDLWIGYELNHPSGQRPASTDLGPALAYSGDMVSLDGGASWESLSNAYALDYNWGIVGIVSSVADGKEIAQPMTWNIKPVSGNPELSGKNNPSFKPEPNNTEATLLGYNVYRNGSQINGTLVTNLQYLDIGLEPGIYNYNVTAVYAEGESYPGNTATVQISSFMSFDIGVFLEGPFNGVAMTTFLNSYGYLPLAQPFNQAPWYYDGPENVVSIPNGTIVDWVLLELRDAPGGPETATVSTVIDRKPAFLKNDGKVVALDGASQPMFSGHEITGNLYCVVWHRNHLGVMSNYPLTASKGNYVYDFFDNVNKAYGGALAQKEVSGKWTIIAGDGNYDGSVNNIDKLDVWALEAGLSGYLQGDFNMNSYVDNADKIDKWTPNAGKTSQVPTNALNTPPTAVMDVTPQSGATSTVFTFDASQSSDPQDPTADLRVRWDFEGDGIWDTQWTTDKIAGHQYTQAGTYQALLQVIDLGGLIDHDMATVTVTAGR